MRKRLLAALAASLLVATLIAACSRGGNPPDAPVDLKAAAGDGQVVLTWTGDTGADWWVFLGPIENISTSNWTSVTGSRAVLGARSPATVTGLTNGTLYSFVVNGRVNGGKGGAESNIAVAVPRPAGDTWTLGTPPGAQTLYGVSYLTPGFWAGGAGGIFVGSSDLNIWTVVPNNLTAGVDVTAVGTVNGRLIVFAADGSIASSTNGIDFAASSNPVPGTRIANLAYQNGAVVAVGTSGTILRTTDGVSWSTVVSGTTANLRGVTAGNNLFVAVGDAGTLLTSPDGITWTPVASGTTADLNAVAFGNAAFVAVGSAGAWTVSADGVTWTPGVPVVTTAMNAIVYGSRFVAVGDAGRVMLSADGLTWATPSSGTTQNLRALTFGAGTYVAVGDAGAVTASR